MANRAGLRKVTKTVRGKKGAVRRSYWVKSQGAANKPMTGTQFLKKHGAKMYGGIAANHALAGIIGHSVSRKHGSSKGLAAGSWSALAGGAAHSITNSGRKATADYNRMGFAGKFVANGVGLVAGVGGLAAGIAASHYAHKHLNHYTR